MSKEVLQALLNLSVAMVSLGFTWLIGYRLTAYWSLRQKRKELELAAAERFYTTYGEFFSVWKLWSYYVSHCSTAPDFFEKFQQPLLGRVATAEAGIEATLLKIASERILSSNEREDLGNLRQAFQLFRECIRDCKPIPWDSSDNPKYLEFKRLACHIGTLLSSNNSLKSPSIQEASAALSQITANKYEANWGGRGQHS